MPVYLTQWRDGDVTIVSANSLEEAMQVFDQTACLDAVDVVELKTPHLNVTLTLGRDGQLHLAESTPAIEEARVLCFPEAVKALDGFKPRFKGDLPQEFDKIIADATRLRRESKLSRKLRKGK